MDMNIDFETFTPPHSPNYALVCPYHVSRDICHQTAPKFSFDVKTLQENWQQFIVKESNITVLADAPENQAWYVQKTRFLGFPDYIVVVFYDLGEGESTVAMYSRSKYGYYDFGVNQKRLARWMECFQQKASSKSR